jgi:epoxyqueuosine reductase QueG
MIDEALTEKVKELVKDLGAFRVGIVDPKKSFSRALEGYHPQDIMSTCKSVIVYAFNVGLDYYKDLHFESSNIRLGHLYRDWTTLELINYLRKKGYDATAVPRALVDEKNMVAAMSLKLAAYEAGIGMFGRPSIIVTPEFGPRVNLGAVLTDARLRADEKMKDFNPCQECDVCANVCPVKAIRIDRIPPTGFDRRKCVDFIDWIRKKTGEKVKLCGFCFNRCPAGRMVTKTMAIKKWVTLDDLNDEKKTRIVSRFFQLSENNS